MWWFDAPTSTVLFKRVCVPNIFIIQVFPTLTVSHLNKILPPALFSLLVYIPFTSMYPWTIYLCNEPTFQSVRYTLLSSFPSSLQVLFCFVCTLLFYGCSWASWGLPNNCKSLLNYKFAAIEREPWTPLLTGISLQQKLFAVLECFLAFSPEGRKPSGYLSKKLAAETAAQIFPQTHVTTSCIKLSLQWFIIMNHENSQPVQCLWVSPLHTNIHSHTQIIKKKDKVEESREGGGGE